MPEPIRILNMSLGGGRAGSGVFAVELASQLQKRGHSVVQACMEGSFTLSCARRENLPVSLIEIRGLYEFEKAKLLAKYVNENNIQIINAHHSGERYLTIFARLLYGSRAKIVITRHAVSGTVPFFGSLIYNIGADMNIAVSKIVYRSMVRDLTFRKKVIYGGINTERFRNPDLLLIAQIKKDLLKGHAGKPVVGMVADYDPAGKNIRGHGKGHRVLFEAVRLLGKKTVLLLIGPVKEHCEDLLHLAVESGLSPDRVVIVPFQENIVPFYFLMDMHVLPSFSESLGLVTLEAMAAGVPCIGTNIGGINEVIDHMKNGLLFEKGSPEDLSKQIRLLLEDDPLRIRIAAAGKERVESFFNMDRVAKETEALFYQLLERP